MRRSSARSARVFICLVVILALGLTSWMAKRVEAHEVRKAIEAANAQWTAAFNRGDAVAVAALYTPDAAVMPPDSEMIRGRQGIREFWQGAIQGGLKDAVLTTVEVQASGSMAYEIGKFSLTVHPKDQAPKMISGKYAVVWKRQADGGWKLHVDIWNSSMPSQ